MAAPAPQTMKRDEPPPRGVVPGTCSRIFCCARAATSSVRPQRNEQVFYDSAVAHRKCLERNLSSQTHPQVHFEGLESENRVRKKIAYTSEIEILK